MKYLGNRLSAAMWSRVLLLWLTLTVGAVVLGGITLWLGGFIHNNINTELTSQQITFSTVDKMADAEKQVSGMVENAGLPLTTGNQAKVYADLMSLHLQEAADGAGYPGATYATLGGIGNDLKTQLATATKAGDTAAADKVTADITKVTNLRNTMLTGSTLRGNLLNAYGWDNVATGIVSAGIFIIVLALVFLVLFIYELQRGHLPPTEVQEIKA